VHDDTLRVGSLLNSRVAAPETVHTVQPRRAVCQSVSDIYQMQVRALKFTPIGRTEIKCRNGRLGIAGIWTEG